MDSAREAVFVPVEVVATDDGAGMIEVIASGVVTRDEIHAAIDQVTAAAAATVGDASALVLVDATGAVSAPDVLAFYGLAEYHVERRHGFRQAVVVTPDLAPAGQFWEDVTVNRGANVRLFTARDEAVEWLLADGI